MVARRSVAPDVAGSIPVTHPIFATPRVGMSRTNRLTRHRRNRYLFWLLALILCLLNSETTAVSAHRASTTRIQTPNGSAGSNHPSVNTRTYVVLISFDGFRPDSLTRYNTPRPSCDHRHQRKIFSEYFSVAHLPGTLLHRDRYVP